MGLVVWELLKTVSLLKSELTKDKIKPAKLIITNKSCKKTNDIILVSNLRVSLKFLIENNMIKIETPTPKIKEYEPTILAKI